MRWVICAVVVLALAPSAFADDYVLRGPEPTYHWGGFYGGAQAGYTTAPVDFSQAAGPQISYILRNTAIENDEQVSDWDVLGRDYPFGLGLGGFVGYNMEWEDSVIFGLELNYNHVSLSASSEGALTRNFTDSTNLPAGHSYFYSVTVGSQSTLHMSDIGTFRARAALEMGNFLPYVFAGFALSHADITTGTSVSYTAVDYPESEEPPLTPLPNLDVGPTGLENSTGTLEYGFATGLGMDVALLPNFFVRGEFEYIYFGPEDGVQVSVTSARVGVGYKF